MAFFPRNYYGSSSASNGGFHPLFRFLEDFDNYQQGEQQSSTSPSGRSKTALTFQPKFDVRELEDRFELHGELPGLSKDKISIEFTDPNTLRVHGSVERTYTSGTPPAGLLQGSKDTEMSGAIADGSGDASDGEKSSNKSHQATVEDEDDAEWTDTKPAAVEKKRTAEVKKQQQKKPRDTAKFWCTERSIGEFSRSFNFPGQIQQDAVSASLTDGILTVSVPKAPKHETRRIAIA